MGYISLNGFLSQVCITYSVFYSSKWVSYWYISWIVLCSGPLWHYLIHHVAWLIWFTLDIVVILLQHSVLLVEDQLIARSEQQKGMCSNAMFLVLKILGNLRCWIHYWEGVLLIQIQSPYSNVFKYILIYQWDLIHSNCLCSFFFKATINSFIFIGHSQIIILRQQLNGLQQMPLN